MRQAMRIAVIGTGISGLTTARLLHGDHRLTVFEAESHIGGHVQTLHFQNDGQVDHVEGGFAQFNPRKYPNYSRLLKILQIETDPAAMTGILHNVDTGRSTICDMHRPFLFGIRELLQSSHLVLASEVLLFFAKAFYWQNHLPVAKTLRDYLRDHQFSSACLEPFVLGAGMAMWSIDCETLLSCSAAHFLRSWLDLVMVGLTGTKYRVIRGGASQVMEALARPFLSAIQTQTPVRAIRRDSSRVWIVTDHGPAQEFDHVIIATNARIALSMLENPTRLEREILSAIGFNSHYVAIHTRRELLPDAADLNLAWNCLVRGGEPGSENQVAIETAWCNINAIQGFASTKQYFMQVNYQDKKPEGDFLRLFRYENPIFSPAAVLAQRQQLEISRGNRTSYCGAYWSDGLHEGGVNSALTVCKEFGRSLADLKPNTTPPSLDGLSLTSEMQREDRRRHAEDLLGGNSRSRRTR